MELSPSTCVLSKDPKVVMPSDIGLVPEMLRNAKLRVTMLTYLLKAGAAPSYAH